MVIVLTLITIAPLISKAGIFEDIMAALKSGNAKEVARYFNSSVELTVPGSDGVVYSKTQAELILKDYLSKNKASAVKIIHRGSSAVGSQFAIGSFETESGNYRIYIFIKETGGTSSIHELSIEKE
jgi:hypothetical protein